MAETGSGYAVPRRWWQRVVPKQPEASGNSSDVESGQKYKPPKWSFGILNDTETDEVPGSVLLMSKREADHNEPLGLRHAPARVSSSSLPSPLPPSPGPRRARSAGRSSIKSQPEIKRTANGQIILDPQPDDSDNDPLNWPAWRRDMALLSLGFICMLGGGMTPVLAAGFTNVADTYGVTVPQVSLTTGLYMLGLGIGSVIFSPTAILYGKRPVYLLGGFLFVVSSVWCALSPNYASLVVARIFQGIAVSPVECLPSATIAEIFFLHERAYRLGIYTLLLLGGKNLIPLISAAIINGLSWQWVFWIVGIVVGFATILLFFFVPETFWDRTPRPSHRKHKGSLAALTALMRPALSRLHSKTESVKTANYNHHSHPTGVHEPTISETLEPVDPENGTIAQRRRHNNHHAHFADEDAAEPTAATNSALQTGETTAPGPQLSEKSTLPVNDQDIVPQISVTTPLSPLPAVHAAETPTSTTNSTSYFHHLSASEKQPPTPAVATDLTASNLDPAAATYTHRLASAPRQPYLATLRPWNGRLRRDSWLKCCARPFVLFAYPAILWSSLVYALSVGWLIVLSESVTTIYRSREYAYNFNALQAGLIYLSPFIGGILGTAIAGRVSDVIVRAMSRRNDGVYEPEFRLVMGVPILLSTVVGLMGFGWAAEERDAWIVPTVFFGVISFGCTLGSTTAITFAVDSYRVYAGEALVTLNFSKSECQTNNLAKVLES